MRDHNMVMCHGTVGVLALTVDQMLRLLLLLAVAYCLSHGCPLRVSWRVRAGNRCVCTGSITAGIRHGEPALVAQGLYCR